MVAANYDLVIKDGIQKASGYKAVVVNGQQTIADDEQLDVFSGKLLRNGTG